MLAGFLLQRTLKRILVKFTAIQLINQYLINDILIFINVRVIIVERFRQRITFDRESCLNRQIFS